VNRTNEMLLDLLREYRDTEPPEVNENMPWALQEETARAHAEWQRHVDGLYALLGVRLVNDALKEDK